MTSQDTTLDEIIRGIQPVDTHWIEKARERTAQLVMPTRALGRMHDLAEKLCAIRQTLTPAIARKAILVMAGDHGAVSDGVSAYPQEVTGAMVQTFLHGGAAINAISRHVGAEVRVVDIGIIPELDPSRLDSGNRFMVHKIAKGTANLVKGPAMDRSDAEKAVRIGFDLASEMIRSGIQILGTGDMGIGNTTPSAAIGAVITGTDLDRMVGRGTGVDDEGLARKRAAIRKAIDVNQPDSADGIDVLAKVGGFEIGGIAGAVLAGAFHRCPVVVDGFISTAGALIAHTLCPTVTDYLFSGHVSEESGHPHMLAYLGLEPILNLNMRLGEGTGGALAMSVLDAAVKVFTEVLTFAEAGVPDKE